MKKNKELSQNKDNKSLSLPFYGVKGSIKDITSDGDYLLVTRYGAFGEEGEKLPTPKKKERDLRENFVNDLRRYLELNHSKYLTCLSKQSKKCFSKDKIFILGFVSLVIAIASVLGLVLTSGNISYVFLATFFVSFIATCHELGELKEYINENKRQKFIHHYKDYFNQLNTYNIEREKELEVGNTKYKGVTKEYSDKVIDINKKKVLEKKSA